MLLNKEVSIFYVCRWRGVNYHSRGQLVHLRKDRCRSVAQLMVQHLFRKIFVRRCMMTQMWSPGSIPLVSIADTTGLASRIAGRWTSWSPLVVPVGVGWFRSSVGKEGGSAWRWRRWVCEVSVVGAVPVGASASVVLQPVLRVVRLFSAAWGASMVFANRNGARNENLRRYKKSNTYDWQVGMLFQLHHSAVKS